MGSPRGADARYAWHALLFGWLASTAAGCEGCIGIRDVTALSPSSGATGGGGATSTSTGGGGSTSTGGGGSTSTGGGGSTSTGGGGGASPITVKGTFVGASVKGTGGAVTVEGVLSWSAPVHASGDGPTVEGWLR